MTADDRINVKTATGNAYQITKAKIPHELKVLWDGEEIEKMEIPQGDVEITMTICNGHIRSWNVSRRLDHWI